MPGKIRFEVLESMISKYGPDAKVSDVIEAERKAVYQRLVDAGEEAERLADEAADRYSDLAADIWDAEGYY